MFNHSLKKKFYTLLLPNTFQLTEEGQKFYFPSSGLQSFSRLSFSLALGYWLLEPKC